MQNVVRGGTTRIETMSIGNIELQINIWIDNKVDSYVIYRDNWNNITWDRIWNGVL